MRRLATFLLLLLALPASAFAWGKQGHRVVATLASQRLTPAARSEVEALLQHNTDGRSLAAVSMWADWVRFHARPETYNWHFVDIPLSRDTYEPGRDCRIEAGRGDCAVAAIERLRLIVGDHRRSHGDRVEALKFLVHLVGDLHQPLHAAERDGDEGAQTVKIVWLGAPEHYSASGRRAWTLHALWDDGLIEASGRNATQQVVRLNTWLATQNENGLRRGTTVDWALEAHAVARSQAYRDADGKSIPRSGARLGRAYYEARIGALEAQLAKAGVRLAQVLNQALR